MKSITAVATLIALVAAPVTALAESTVMHYHDGAKALSNVSNYALVSEPTTTTQSQVVTAKTLVRNTSAGTLTVECKLSNTVSGDYAVATLAPGAWATLSAQIAAAAGGAARYARFDCYITSGQTSGAQASWAKMTVRYGAPSVSVRAW
jgi:hypothetical protein